MVGRRSLVVIVLALVGLWVWPGPSRRPATAVPDEPVAAVDEATAPGDAPPLVAVRGQPLAPHEEPLPVGARVRIGSTRYRHPTNLRETSWLSGRDYLVTISDGRLILTEHSSGRRVWDRHTGSASYALWGGQLGYAFAVSADGRRLVTEDSGGGEGEGPIIRLWDLDPDPDRPIRPRVVLPYKPEPVWSGSTFYFTPDGRELLVRDSNALAVFDVASGAPLRRFESRTAILDVAPAAGLFLTSSDRDPTGPVQFLCGGGMRFQVPVYRFHPPTPKPEEPALPTREDVFTSRRRGTTAAGEAYGSFDLFVRDTTSGGVVATIPAPRDPGAKAGHFHLSPDGRHVSAEFNSDVLVWEIATGRRVLRLRPTPGPGGRHSSFAHVRFDPNGRTVVALEWPDRERHFELVSGREVPGGPRGLALGEQSVPGTDLVVRVDDAGAVRRRDARTGHELPLPPGYADVVMDVSPDGQLIAVGDGTGRLDVWRPDGSVVAGIRAGGKGIRAVAFSPDGRRLAACDAGRTVRIWSARTWAERDRIEVPADHDELCPEHLAFSPDGRWLVVSQQDIMALWDLTTRAWAWDQPGHRTDWSNVRGPVFFPDGEHLLTSTFARINARLGPLPGAEQFREAPWLDLRDVRSFALSADARQVATSRTSIDSNAEDYGLAVRESTKGKLMQTFPESRTLSTRTGRLRFSPDGRRLITCDGAGHAHLWEVASGQLARTLTYPDGAIHDVRFGADGRTLITANHREVIVWDLAPDPGAVADPWADLAHEAPKAERARQALLADPAASVDLLKGRLRPAAPVDPSAVSRLVAGLDADDYRRRERAAVGLRAVGQRVLPLLREAKVGSEEARVRLASLIRELEAGPTADELRQVRAVEVLEQIGSPAARVLLDELAAGDPEAVLTAEAGTARARGR